MANINVNESDGVVRIPIRPFSAATEDIVVNYAIEQFTTNSVAEATITGMEADISDPNGGTVTIPTGTSFTMPHHIVINIIDDITAEPQEDFILRLTSVTTSGYQTGAGLRSTRVFIAASDNQPTFAIVRAVDNPANEGETARFRVTLGGTAPTGTVTVDWMVDFTGMDSVTAGDFAPGTDTSGTLSFTSRMSQPIDFPILDDSAREDAETLTVRLSGNSAGTALGTASASRTIAASDQPHARTLTVTGPTSLTETDGNVESGNYTIALTGTAFPSATTVTWTVSHGTTVDADFVAASDRTDTVSFGTSDTTQTFTLTIAGDDLNEGTESFSVQVSVADAMANGGTGYGAAATTTITDDDPITATVTTATAAVDEGDTADFTVTLTEATATEAVVITYTGDEATGMLSIPAGTTTGTLTLTATDDSVSEGQDSLTIDMNSLTATSAGAVTIAGSATLTINADMDDNITVTIAAPASANSGQTAAFTVRMSNASAAAVTVAYDVTLTVDGSAVTIPPANITDTVSPIAAGSTSGSISVTIPADVSVGESGSLAVTLTSATAATGGGTAMLGATATRTATVAITSDDPAAREARLEAPLASAGEGIGQLAAAAVVGRLRAAGAGGGAGNSLSIAGRELMQSRGLETLTADFLAAGYATGERDLSVEELLRGGSFNLTGGDNTRGFNFWGSGEYVAAEGDHDGIDYDGDTTAFHLGLDTHWKRGLIGVAIGRSSGEVDFTVEADGSEHTLETEVTGVHPYFTARVGRAQVWAMAGHGSGDAELLEPDAVIKTDITVTTAAVGATRARGELFTGGVSAIYSRAKLDEAVGSNKTLNATSADSLRVKADAELGWSAGAFNPFMTFALRHDSGDGDTGGAADLGGGVEYRAPTILVRLTGSGSIAGQGSDETRAVLSVRKSTGNFDLGLNLTADGDGDIDTGRLVTGEWRF